MTFKGKACSDHEDIANLFADYFSEVYVKSENDNIDSESFHYMDRCKKLINIMNISISESSILTALNTIKPSNCPGPDNVPSILIRNCSDALSTPLYLLFNRSLSVETIPDVWKISYL